MSGDIYLTQKGYEQLVSELEHLKTVKRRQLSKAIGEARAHGDISENAEYDAAKDAQGMNEKRISELEKKLATAQILDDSAMTSDEVLIGATVKLKDMKSGEEIEYTLVSEEEADYSQNKISVTSPVGMGLLNHKVKDTVEINVPAGVMDGNYMTLRGEGNAGKNGGASGDIIVIFEELPHENFTRDGDNVIYELYISYPEAVLGTEVEVPTLNGKAKLKIDPGTQAGKFLKMREKGIQHLNSHGAGDQLVKVNIHIPKTVNQKEKEMLKELQKLPNIKI